MSRYYSFRQLQQKLQTKKPANNDNILDENPQSKLEEYQQQFQQNLNRYQTIIQEQRENLNMINSQIQPREQQTDVQQLLAKSQLSLDQLENGAETLQRQLDVLRSGTLEQLGDQQVAQQIILLKSQLEEEQAEKDNLRLKVSDSYKQLQENQHQIHELEVLVRSQQMELEGLKTEQLKKTEEDIKIVNQNQSELARLEEEIILLKAKEYEHKEAIKKLEDELRSKEKEASQLNKDVGELKKQLEEQQGKVLDYDRLEHELLEYKVHLDEKHARILHLENSRTTEIEKTCTQERKSRPCSVSSSGMQNYEIAFTVINQEKNEQNQSKMSENDEIKQLKSELCKKEAELREKNKIIAAMKQATDTTKVIDTEKTDMVAHISTLIVQSTEREKMQQYDQIPFFGNQQESVDINKPQESQKYIGTYPHLPQFIAVEIQKKESKEEVIEHKVEKVKEIVQQQKVFDFEIIAKDIKQTEDQYTQEFKDKCKQYVSYLDKERQLQKLLAINSKVSQQYEELFDNYAKFYVPYARHNAIEEQRRRNIMQSVQDVTIESQNNIVSHTIDTTEYGEDFTKHDLRIKIFNLREKNGRHTVKNILKTPQMTTDEQVKEVKQTVYDVICDNCLSQENQ